MSTIVIETIKSLDGTVTKKARCFGNEGDVRIYIDGIVNECRENKDYTNEVDKMDAFGYYYDGTRYCEQFTRVDRHDNVWFCSRAGGDKLFLIHENIGMGWELSGFYGDSSDMMDITSRLVMHVIGRYGDSCIRKIDDGYVIEEANGGNARARIEMFDI